MKNCFSFCVFALLLCSCAISFSPGEVGSPVQAPPPPPSIVCSENGDTEISPELELEAYTSILYPAIVERCSACHTEQSPAFVKQDVAASWEIAQDLTEKFLKKERDLHCGGNCAAPGIVSEAVITLESTLCSTVGAPEWAVEPNRYFSDVDTLATLGQVEEDVVFSMNAEAQAPFTNVQFVASIRRVPGSGALPESIVIGDIRIITDEPLTISGFQLWKNGDPIVNESFGIITRDLQPSPAPQLLISGTTVLELSTTDELALSGLFSVRADANRQQQRVLEWLTN